MSLPLVTLTTVWPGLRVAVAGLGVGQRAHLVEPVQVGARQAVRLALVEVPAQADVPVGEREHRLGLGEQVEVELGLAQRPRLDRERRVLDHGARSSSARSLDDDVGAVRAQRVGLADPVDADDEAEAAGAPGLPRRRARPRTPPPAPGSHAERPRAGEERVGRRLAVEVLALGDVRRRRSPRTGPRCPRRAARRGSSCSRRRRPGAAGRVARRCT